MTLSQTMACRNVMTILSTMQKQNLHTVENQSHPKKTIPTYKPNIWKYDHLLSLKSEYSKKKYKVEAEKLINEVSCTFSNTVSLALLELVDRIDKFGLSSYFEVETKEALEKIIKCMNSGASYSSSKDEDLYAIALCFRLLREHGYHASQDMLKGLFAGKGKLMTKKVSDIKTLLELLEGSYLSMDDENLQNDIRIFSTKNLKNLSTSNVDRFSTNGEYLSNSLKYNPLAFRVRWYDVRRHLNAQEELECYTNPMLLKLAKLNFNIIQATHQKDLKHVIRWWRNLCIVEDLSFTRDRIVESFFYAVGVTSEPQHGSMRKWLTKVIQLILIIDDVYDIYGSLPDVEQFTCAIEKWDPNEVQCLPECMQICFRTLHDTMEEISVEIQQQKGGPSALPYLKQVWVNFCKALLVEATWYHKGHIPTLEEYLDNGWISSSGPLLSCHVIFGLTNEITNETLDLCKNCKEIIYHTSVIIRLCNDKGTSTAELERGDVASSILCYMQEENVSEEVAREHIESIILDSWKKINYHFNTLSTSHRKLVKHVINEARMAHVMYQFGDGFGVQDGETRDHILFNLVEPLT
ncbi:alpha-farnesene synthase-like isoform X1 [Lycium ferocissimum]|uniref:alpha-farnesene synthase-like isoform X1 n=1 Tax=Lycium ferocissimum TaxID=112874 RepID=UPI0028155D94|nr:alpha-farnesene synthase-like isoform X1 [Lycium ferocissimum]